MRKFIGFIVVVIVLIVIFLLASPVYYGKTAERVAKQMVANTNKDYGKYGVHAVLQGYQRHWYSSTAEVLVTVNSAAAKLFYKKNIDPNFDLKQPIRFHEMLSISHGPVIYASHAHGRFAAAYVRGFVVGPKVMRERLHLSQPIVHYAGRLSYRGVFTGSIIVSPIVYDSPNNSTRYGGVTIYARITPNLDSITGTSLTQSMISKSNKNSGLAVISGMHSQFDLHKTPSGLWVGKSTGAVGSVKLFVPGGPMPLYVIYKDYHPSLSLKKIGDAYSISLGAKMASLTYEKGKTVRDLDFVLNINNLNASVFKRIQDAVLAVAFDPEQHQQTWLFNTLVAQTPKLLTNKTNIALKNLSVQLPNGQIRLSADLRFPNLKPGMPVFGLLMAADADLNIMAAQKVVDYYVNMANQKMNAYQAEKQKEVATEVAKTRIAAESAAHGKAHKTLPTMEPGPVLPPQNTIQRTFESYLQKGWIQKIKGNYHTHIQYQAGRIIANGHQFN